jgi:hypothetical protein
LRAPAASARGGRRRAESLSCAIADGAPISASTIASSGFPSGGGDAGVGPGLHGAGAEQVRGFFARSNRATAKGPPGRLLSSSFQRALSQHRQLHFAHGTLHAEQQAVVGMTRIVDAVLISNQRACPPLPGPGCGRDAAPIEFVCDALQRR